MMVRIEQLAAKKLIGSSLKMSLADDKTFQLWRTFMPRRKLIKNVVGTDLYSIQVYDDLKSFQTFQPTTIFEKRATIEVSAYEDLPEEMETYHLEGGLYAVFIHKGLAQNFPKTMQYIFGEWLPKSDYQLDHRPHFELLGDKYKNNDPNSEEEVWIPIKWK